jgi:hypothetical protein
MVQTPNQIEAGLACQEFEKFHFDFKSHLKATLWPFYEVTN